MLTERSVPSAAKGSTVAAPKLLIVDDDETIRSQLELSFDTEFEILAAADSEEAWRIFQSERPDLMTLDLALEYDDVETGFSLLERCLQIDPFMKIVLITGNDEQTNAQRAVDMGASDFFGKPVDPKVLEVLLHRLYSVGQLERQNAAILKRQGDQHRLGAILGLSSEMHAVFRTIEKVATADVSVLILGESGTGKELAAKEIRRLSTRATKPFVSINCGAIPENLLESELFGHEKGSFTGAHTSRAGKLELANEGIVFLDEIADLPLALQVKLLRFLQDHEIDRVGGRKPIALDVRVIAATNRDLDKRVASGQFREDLFYRLSVVNLRLPPLRERSDDILFLAHYFLERFGSEYGRGKLTLTADARRGLRAYKWPGNVRELEHRVQKAALMSAGTSISANDLELNGAGNPRRLSLREARTEADRFAVIESLRATNGNISEASRRLGISRPSLHELLRKLEVNAKDYKRPKRRGVAAG
jgi:two-component system NtrC family response regulator